MNRKLENQRTYAKRIARQRDGIPGVPSLPDDIAYNDNCLTEEQERTASMVIEAATWAIWQRREAREDVRRPVTPREFVTDPTYGLAGSREVGR